jgi:hypothetical protein
MTQRIALKRNDDHMMICHELSLLCHWPYRHTPIIPLPLYHAAPITPTILSNSHTTLTIKIDLFPLNNSLPLDRPTNTARSRRSTAQRTPAPATEIHPHTRNGALLGRGQRLVVRIGVVKVEGAAVPSLLAGLLTSEGLAERGQLLEVHDGRVAYTGQTLASILFGWAPVGIRAVTMQLIIN